MKANRNFFFISSKFAEVNLVKLKQILLWDAIVKNGSVISSGITSVSGRPHAEFNAYKINYLKFDLYVF